MMRFGSVTYRVHIRIYVIYSYYARPRPDNFTGLGWVLDQQAQWNLEIWTWPIPTTCKCSGSWWARRGLHTGECRNVNEWGSGWVHGGPNLDLDLIYFMYWASMTPAWFRLNPEPDPIITHARVHTEIFLVGQSSIRVILDPLTSLGEQPSMGCTRQLDQAWVVFLMLWAKNWKRPNRLKEPVMGFYSKAIKSGLSWPI